MSMRSWAHHAISRPLARPIRKGRHRPRLGVEVLEDRTVPSTFTVANLLDDGSVGSLRWAVDQANTNPGDDTIDFDPTVFGTPQTIALTGTQLELTDTSGTQSIAGPAAGVTVDGGGLSRVFQVDALVTASISGLTIGGGSVGSFGNGGGLYNAGTVALTNCTVSGNSAANGAGLWSSGTATLTDSTISGNTANGYFGGGLSNYGTATLTNCTVSGNSAGFIGGIYTSYYSGTATLTNTIVAGNGGFEDVGFGGFSGTNNLIGGNPMLAPLGNYGGPTQTMPLLPGSPAIDAGTSGADVPTTDQRGLGRVGAVDVGAFESQGFALTPAPGSTPQTSQIGTPFANPLAVTVTANNPSEPVDGGVVNFVANNVSGATAILSASSAVIGGGQAVVTAAPDNAIGSYTVVASTVGASPASFALTNAGPIFASLVVNTTSGFLFPGTGLLSLPEAVAFANFDSAGISAITFDNQVFATPQTISLTGNQLELSNTSEPESIAGPAAGVTIDGGGLSRVFQVDALVTASISGLTIAGGNVGYYNSGGGVLNNGTLALTNCTITGNSATGSYFSGAGGGVANNGTVTLTNCTVSGNSGGYSSGGGLLNLGTATLTNCTVTGNTAGGGFFGGGGGGVANGNRFFGPSVTLTMTNCVLSGNSAYAGGGLYNAGTATLTDCTVSGNTATGFFGGGGGVATGSIGNSSATTTLTGCTISGNQATGYFGFGGGVSNYGTTTMTDCTISGNSATTSGGGLFSSATPFGGYNPGTLTLTDCTISGNTALNGGGVFTQGGAIAFYFGGSYHVITRDGATNLNNCTVSGNTATGEGGGLATSGIGTTTATNCTISGNSASNGGGVSTDGFVFFGNFDGTTNLTDCTVSGNTATGNGGGLVNTALGSTAVTGTAVHNNSANVGGGMSNQGTLSVDSSSINNNQATAAGGGISTTGGSATIANSAINSNLVISLGTALGGGIDCENSTLSLTNCSVNANRANGATALGGGIYVLDSTVEVQGSTVNGNRANGTVLGEGGGIYSSGSILTLLGTTVKGNKASTDFDNVFVGP